MPAIVNMIALLDHTIRCMIRHSNTTCVGLKYLTFPKQKTMVSHLSSDDITVEDN